MMQGQWMRMTIASIAFIAVAVSAHALLPPASEVLPPGFKVLDERNMGPAASIRATKPNEKSPKGDSDKGIKIDISWQINPMADRLVDMIASQPESKAGDLPGLGREEPCGKQRYRGGVLTCRKWITNEMGSDAPARVALKFSWQGKGADGLINITISNFSGSQETAMGWMDTMIPKVTYVKE